MKKIISILDQEVTPKGFSSDFPTVPLEKVLVQPCMECNNKNEKWEMNLPLRLSHLLLLLKRTPYEKNQIT